MDCPDCSRDDQLVNNGMDRREFLRTTSVAGAALGALAVPAAGAASKLTGDSETLVGTLYNSLAAE